MVELNFDVKVDLVMSGKICPPSMLRSGAPAGPCDALLSLESEQPTDIRGFYLAAWVGAGSQEFSLGRVGDSGEVSVRKFSVRQGDVGTLKFAVAFRQGPRCCHLASSFLDLQELASVLEDKPAGQGAAGRFASSQRCLVLKDNFTTNKAALRFLNAGTDLRALKRLVPALRESTLSSLSVTGDAVQKLTAYLEKSISHCAVSPLNAGVQFLDCRTFGNMSGHLTSYPLLNHLFKSLSSPVNLKMVMYDAYQAMHSTDLSLAALEKMPDMELALRWGVPLITRHTGCALTNVYQTDYTVNVVGQVCKLRETEDISRTFSALDAAVRSDLDDSLYPTPGQSLSSLALAQAIDQLDRAGVTRSVKNSQKNLVARVSKAAACEDCENLSLANLMKFKGVLNAYESYGPRGLASRMASEAGGDPLFAVCTASHHAAMARCLCRLGAMIKSGDWDTAFLVASAKSASYSLDDPGSASTLNGHGAGISRVRDARTGQFVHAAVEGTTYATVDRPMPEGYPSVLPIKLMGQGGEPDKVVPMNLAELMTSVGQNLHRDVGLSQHAAVQAHFLHAYKDAQECPFYVSAFYTGLSEGGRGSIGCVPVDTCPSPHFLAGDKPLFGAPVMGLSEPSTMAIPISAETFAAAGVENPERVLKLMADQVEEAWGPQMSPRQIQSLMSYWQPVKSPDHPQLTGDNYAQHVRSEVCWAFDDPQHTALAVRVLEGLAERFNALQAADPASDGARAFAYGQYLSSSLRITMPVPKNNKGFSLSTMRNVRKAGDDIGLKRLSACPIRAAMINVRAKVKSDHVFYMCDKGEGLVHSYNYRLA